MGRIDSIFGGLIHVSAQAQGFFLFLSVPTYLSDCSRSFSMQLRYIEMSDQSQCILYILNTVGVKGGRLDRRDVEHTMS